MTIQDKLLVGYQGWFTCAGDGDPMHPGHHGWLHWFNQPLASGGRPNTDLWPDLSEYEPNELFLAPGLTTATGDPVYLFSSRHPKTVRRHFHWMALHGVDGAFLQRFAGQCEIKPGNRGIRDMRDEIGERVREAAEAEGRDYAIMYDVTGVAPDKIQQILEQDWIHLLAEQRLLESPAYLRENGKPVVALWGFGFHGRNHTPDLVRAITAFFRSNTSGGVYIVAGTPGHWRTSSSDADRNPEFLKVWTECFDAICPWTVGRYGNEEDANRWGQDRLKGDADYLRTLQEQGGRKVDYIPVVLPGGSGFNLSKGKWGMNDIKRNGGRFLWRQIYNAHRAGVRTMYGAMWDEYDEGTAFMPIVSSASQLPVHPSYRFLALDVDGHELPSDWYMRIAGFAAEALHGERTLSETLPYQELQEYWNTRPRRGGEKRREAVEEVTHALEAWQVSGGVPTDAPPPYSLEDSSGPGPSVQPPPVPYDSRPLPSHASFAAGVPLAGAAVVHTLSSGSTSAARYRAPPLPPPVDMSTRPYHPSPEMVLPAPRFPEPRPHHGSSFSGPQVVRGRSRSRSRSRERPRSGSRQRRQRQDRRHSRSRSHSRERRSSPGRYHHHSQSGPHGMMQPSLSEGGYGRGRGGYEPVRQGLYTPVHSTPLGHAATVSGGPYGPGGGYVDQQQYPQQGFGQGELYQRYGYTPHASSSFYTPSGPGGNDSGNGRGLQDGLLSALKVVENVTGKHGIARRVENKVKTLSNTAGGSLFKRK